jgi:hypothetical protein
VPRLPNGPGFLTKGPANSKRNYTARVAGAEWAHELQESVGALAVEGVDGKDEDKDKEVGGSRVRRCAHTKSSARS